MNGARVRWYCGGGGSNDEKAGSADPPTQCGSGVLGLRIIFPDCVAKGNLNDPTLKDVSTLTTQNNSNNYTAGEKITDPDPDTGQREVIDPDTGQVIDSFDADPNTLPNNPSHRLHMVRSKPQDDGFRGCPSTHSPVPTLTINANFEIGTSSGKVTLSSDAPGDPPGSTIHTDFWNTWDQSAEWNPDATNGAFGGLEALVVNCINAVPPTDPRPTQCRAPTATA